MKIKQTISLLILLWVGTNAQAQELKMIDVYAMPNIVWDSINYTYVYDGWRIGFKINRCELVDKIVIQLGSTENESNAKSLEVPVVEINGIYFLSYNSELYKVQGYEAYVDIDINEEEMANFYYVSAYGRDFSGNHSKRKTLRIR